MKNILRILTVFIIVLFVYGCQTTVHVPVNPVAIEKPQNLNQTKPILDSAILTTDAHKTTKYTKYDYDIMAVNIEYEIPSGALLTQAVRYYFSPYVKQTYFERNSLEDYKDNTMLIYFDVSSMSVDTKQGFSKQSLDINATLKVQLYNNDNNYLIAFPISKSATATAQISGVFNYFKNEDYANTSANAIIKALQQIPPIISSIILNPQDTIAQAKKMIETEPLSQSSYAILANAALLSKDYTQAIAASKMLIELNPKSIIGYEFLALSYLQKNDENSAKKVILEALNKNIETSKNLYLDYLIKTKDYQKAQEWAIQNKLKVNPKSAITFLISQKQYTQAIDFLQKQLIPNAYEYTGIGVSFADYYSTDGYLVLEQINPLLSDIIPLKAGDKIIKINNTSTKYIEDKKISELIKKEINANNEIVVMPKNTEQTITVNIPTRKIIMPDAACAFGWLSIANYLNNNFNDAKMYSNMAYKLDSNSNIAKIALALSFIHDRDFTNANKLLTSTVDTKTAQIVKSILLAEQGNFKESINNFTSIQQPLGNNVLFFQLKPLFMASINPFIETLLASADQDLKTGQYKKALDAYSHVLNFVDEKTANKIKSSAVQIINSNPSLVALDEDSNRKILKAQVYLEDNKLDKALDELKEVIATNPFNPQIYYDAALISAKNSDYKNAIKLMQEYLTLNPNAKDADAVKNEIYKWELKLKENDV